MAYRSNEQWLLDLRGAHGKTQQQQAHMDLANYLYRVAYNYLELRKGDLPILKSFAPEDQGALAQDFVQETLEKIARNNYALLDSQFSGTGRFVAWAAAIVQNQARQELRKSYWKHRVSFGLSDERLHDTDSDLGSHAPVAAQVAVSSEPSPEMLAMQEQITRILRGCIDHLEERRRLAVEHCLVEDRETQEVADMLKITKNAVYLLLHRARKDLQNCLARSDIDADILEIFQP